MLTFEQLGYWSNPFASKTELLASNNIFLFLMA